MLIPHFTSGTVSLGWSVSLARTHSLSCYDAVNLELAKRRDAALASLGGALTRAAALEGVQLVDQ